MIRLIFLIQIYLLSGWFYHPVELDLMEKKSAKTVPETDADVVTIPLKRAGRLLLIEAEIDGQRGNFIFDTGAPYLVLNKTYFRKYPRKRVATAGTITGAIEDIERVNVDNLSFKEIYYKDLSADLVNLGQIETARGVKILGLMGLSLFESFEMEINVRENFLKLYKTNAEGECLSLPPRAECEFIQPISVYDHTIFAECEIAGKKLRFGFDTGAETNALNSRTNKKVLETISITGRRKLNGVGEGSLEIIYGRINYFKFGGTPIFGMQTLITNMDGMNVAYGTRIDGMLGYDFLAKGTVRVNCRKELLKLCLFDKFSNE